MKKCEVCGKEGNVAVCCSGLVPFSFSYCDECLTHLAEPYWVLVALTSQLGGWNRVDWNLKRRIKTNLEYLHKDFNEFLQDVDHDQSL